MVRMSALIVMCLIAGRGNASDAAKVIHPFNGKDLSGWKTKKPEERSKWVVGKAVLGEKANQLTVGMPTSTGDAQMVNATSGGVDIFTDEKFGDCRIELEFMIPKGSNSGIYVHGEYEVQILDSYGKEKVGPGDLGGLYGASAPKVNASKKPGEWQKFVIDFQAPKFESDKKVANAKFLKVMLNDQLIHENVEMKGPTPSGVTGKEAATGPLMFQGDHGPVAVRNIKITPRGTK